LLKKFGNTNPGVGILIIKFIRQTTVFLREYLVCELVVAVGAGKKKAKKRNPFWIEKIIKTEKIGTNPT